MKTINDIKHLILVCIFIPIFTSCNNWLAVDMEDGMLEDKLYESNEGYMTVLNGVYARLNENYSTTLSMTILDVMAQYYNVRQNTDHIFHVYGNYTFDDKVFEETSSSVWARQYAQIANLNTLLTHIDAEDSNIKVSYYSFVKGEALALRAFLHFDLIRLYGPIYNSATENITCIPYQESDSKEIQPLLPAKDVMGKIIRDLKEAAELLEEDPVRTKGVMAEDSEDLNETNDFRYRQYRLNYYAVKTLLARAYLWVGDKANALLVSKELIVENDEKKVFPWITKADVLNAEIPDLLFSTEVIFGLYNTSRVSVFNQYFKETTTINNALVFKGERLNDISCKLPYYFSDDDDLRRGSNFWSEETLEQMTNSGSASQPSICFKKYADIPGTTKPFRYMIPMIRMSEIYLMAAECTDDLTESIGYINEIRNNRNCVDLNLQPGDTKESIQQYITNEFIREVIGEGQLYFYYKRLGMEEILSGTEFSEDRWLESINLQNYVWPLPKTETDQRVNVN